MKASKSNLRSESPAREAIERRLDEPASRDIDAARSPAARAILAALLLHVAAVSAEAGDADGQAAPPAVQSGEADLDELGQTLKAAVLSGSLSTEEATKIYWAMAERMGDGGKKAGDGGDAKGKGAKGADSSKRDVTLSAPRPEQISVLFRPEFARGDLTLLRQGLDLEQPQEMIARVLLDDYLESYDVATTPLREALRRHQRTTTEQWIFAALERARDVDPDAAAENAELIFEKLNAAEGADDGSASEQKRIAAEDWAERMREVTREMEDRLAALRARVASEIMELEREGAAITAADLVRMAKQLRADRRRLRQELASALELITNEAQRGEAGARLEIALSRVRLGHLLPQGRLGGESMDVWASWTEVSRGIASDHGRAEQFAAVEGMLQDRLPWIAQRLDERTEATLDRELAGLEFQAARDRIVAANGGSTVEVERERLASAIRPFADAARREITASLAVRDALLALLSESSALVEEAYPDSAIFGPYRADALGRGFPLEMRQRWSERAIAAALELEMPAEDASKALLALQADTKRESDAIRNDAIAKRIERDPKLAREQLEARFGDEEREIEVRAEWWLGINHEAFTSIDDRIEAQLRAILAPEQFASLPLRIRPEAKDGGGKAGGQKTKKPGGK